MADKTITELAEASSVFGTDLFVLEQGGTAKKLSGSTLIRELANALDGHGGISSITKTGTNGLADTYRISYADGTGMTYTVLNGNGIRSITKTGTSGLVDTYTIAYTDGSTGAFTVTNGAKGDTGEAMYCWIKYASVDPDESVIVSIGDAPDEWMGVYTGYAQEAPSDPSAYRWYRIRGDQGIQGDKGSPGETYTTSVTYGVSDSPAVYPVTWYESITSAPVVSGAYVWSRVQYLNSSNVVVNTAYSVSHIGQNGTGAGTVTSVTFGDTVYQDVAGNVTIPMPSSEDVGAVADPKTKAGGQFLQWDASAEAWVAATPTGSVTTVNGVGVTAGTTNIRLTAKDIGPYHARNLLDNSDFRNPVNQRGANRLTAVGYFIDRWTTEESNTSLSLGDGYLTIGNGHITQRVPEERIDVNKSYTIAAMKVDGTLLVASGIASNVIGSFGGIVFAYTYGLWRFYISATGDYLWAALYEGTYTAETLPEYRCKGYGSELAECQRYYQIRSANNIAAVDMRPTMRLSSPTITGVSGGYAYSADL